MTERQFKERFPIGDNDACCAYLIARRWPQGVACPRCGDPVVYELQSRKSYWSIFKRGVVGTFHKVGAKYMPLYVAEFQFRYNNRFNAHIFGTAIAGA
jgi:ISXO2-like transposase domain/Transposase zinc-ribbon domain